MALGAALAEAFATFTASRHVEVGFLVKYKKLFEIKTLNFVIPRQNKWRCSMPMTKIGTRVLQECSAQNTTGHRETRQDRGRGQRQRQSRETTTGQLLSRGNKQV
jgi:hypothetical protein